MVFFKSDTGMQGLLWVLSNQEGQMMKVMVEAEVAVGGGGDRVDNEGELWALG